MARQVQSGWLEGHAIRTARKAHRCDYRNGRGYGSGPCPNTIQPGDLYVEGEMDPYRAGGFATERYCLECAGPDARASLVNLTVSA